MKLTREQIEFMRRQIPLGFNGGAGLDALCDLALEALGRKSVGDQHDPLSISSRRCVSEELVEAWASDAHDECAEDTFLSDYRNGYVHGFRAACALGATLDGTPSEPTQRVGQMEEK
jgi:hypothetical protein